jgi:hypothetical protein
MLGSILFKQNKNKNKPMLQEKHIRCDGILYLLIGDTIEDTTLSHIIKIIRKIRSIING